MKTKKFDCVEMKHRGAEAVLRRIKGMTVAEQVSYWHKRTEELRRKQIELRNSHKKAVKH